MVFRELAASSRRRTSLSYALWKRDQQSSCRFVQPVPQQFAVPGKWPVGRADGLAGQIGKLIRASAITKIAKQIDDRENLFAELILDSRAAVETVNDRGIGTPYFRAKGTPVLM